MEEEGPDWLKLAEFEMGGRTGRDPELSVDPCSPSSRDVAKPDRGSRLGSIDRLESRLVEALGYADWIGLRMEETLPEGEGEG